MARSGLIDFRHVRVGPAAALAAASGLPVARMRLISVQGHPRYVLSLAGGTVLSISGESGKPLGPLPAGTARAVAESFSGHPVTRIAGPLLDDQCIVHEQYDQFRPFYKVALGDRQGTELYVSTRSGEVLQRTRPSPRRWPLAGRSTMTRSARSNSCSMPTLTTSRTSWK